MPLPVAGASGFSTTQNAYIPPHTTAVFEARPTSMAHLELTEEHLTDVLGGSTTATTTVAPVEEDNPFAANVNVTTAAETRSTITTTATTTEEEEVDVLGHHHHHDPHNAAAAAPHTALGFIGDVLSQAKLLALRAAAEVANPNSTLRTGLTAVGHAATTAARSMHNEVSNEHSDFRTNILPAVKASVAVVATTVVAATRAVAHEVSDPTSDLRSKILPSATARVGSVAHEVTDPTSAFRVGYVAPVVAATSAVVASAAHEVTSPTSNLRAHVLPAAVAATSAVAHTISNEFTNAESHTRAHFIPNVVAAGEAVATQVTDPASALRSQVIPAAIHEITDPTSHLRTKTVETVAGAVATGVSIGGVVTKAVLVTTGDVVGKGLLVASTAASASLGAAGDAMQVSPETHARVEQVGTAVKSAVVVSGVLVAGASAVVAGLGASAATAIRATSAGDYLETTSGGRAIVAAGTATAAAVGQVFAGAVEGATILSSHSTVATTQFVGVRYGAEAAAVALQGAAVVGDVGRIATNAVLLSPVVLVGQASAAAVHTTATQVDEPPTLPPAIVQHDTEVE